MARPETRESENPFPVKELARRVWRELDADNVTGLAAQISYYFALALFPFLIFLAALVGSLPFTNLWDSVLKWITRYLHSASQHLIFDTVASLTHGHRRFLSIGLLGTAWASCTGVMNLMCALNTAYEVKETRPFCRRVGFAFVMLLVIAFLFVASFALLTTGDCLNNWLATRMGAALPVFALWHVGRWIVSLLLLAFGVSVIDHALPNVSRRWRWITPGTLFFVAVSAAATVCFNLYVRYVASYDKTYGALGAFVILLVWVYITSLILLVGAEINCELGKMGTRQSLHRLKSGRPDRRETRRLSGTQNRAPMEPQAEIWRSRNAGALASKRPSLLSSSAVLGFVPGAAPLGLTRR